MYKVTRTSFSTPGPDGAPLWLTKHSTHEEIAAIPGEALKQLIKDGLVTETKDEPPTPEAAPTPAPAARRAAPVDRTP